MNERHLKYDVALPIAILLLLIIYLLIEILIEVKDKGPLLENNPCAPGYVVYEGFEERKEVGCTNDGYRGWP